MQTRALIRELKNHFLDKDKLAKLIRDPRADINFQEIWGKTPLMIAVESGHENIVRMILGHPKIDVNKRNLNWDTALILAIHEGNRGIVQMILEHPKIVLNLKAGPYENTALHEAIRINDVGMAELILSFASVSNLSVRNFYRYKPLPYARIQGNEEIIKLLVDFKKQSKKFFWNKILGR